MNDTPLVSIVTPAHNQGRFLAETIESVLAQDYSRIEYSVIDDGSTDETAQVLKQYAGKITTLTQQNLGQAQTINRGWSNASGKYVGYLSSDDILFPNAISYVVAKLEQNPDAVAAYPDADHIDYATRTIRRNVCRPFDYDQLVVTQECFIGPGALIRKSALARVGGWRSDLRRTPDREFWMRLGTLGKILMVPKALAGYRIHEDSTSYKDDDPDTAMEYVRVAEEFFSSANVPERLRSRKNEAMGWAYLIAARARIRSGYFRSGLTAFNTACSYHPPIRYPRVVLRQLRSIVGRPLRRLTWRTRQFLGRAF